MQIPGVDSVVAAVLIAEIEVDMSVFLSVYHLAAWAGVLLRAATVRALASRRAGAPARAMCSLAHHARRRRHFRRAYQGRLYLKDKFHRLRGAPRRHARRYSPSLTRSSSQLPITCLPRACAYRELGEAYLDQIAQSRTVTDLERRIERLGCTVRALEHERQSRMTPTSTLKR